jgi:hypothetical protein
MSAALVGCVEPAPRGSSSDIQAEPRRFVLEDRTVGSETPEPTITEIVPDDPDTSLTPQQGLIQDVVPGQSGELWRHPDPPLVDEAAAETESPGETPDTPLRDSVAGAAGEAPEGSGSTDAGPRGNMDGSEETKPGNAIAASGMPSQVPSGVSQGPAPQAGGLGSSLATQIMTAVPPEPVKPSIDDNPDRLMGMDTGDLTQVLGSPRFVRRDASAQLWRYRSASCVLDLFLYRNEGRPEYLVSHVEARASGGGNAEKRECFGALLLERLDRDAS